MNSMEDAHSAKCQVQECMQVSILTFAKKCQWTGKNLYSIEDDKD
jgi:hypothetical protein